MVIIIASKVFFLPLKIKCNQPTYGELKNKKMPWYGEAIFKVGQACDGGLHMIVGFLASCLGFVGPNFVDGRNPAPT